MEVVKELERQLMPALHALRHDLRVKLPAARVRVFSNGGGDLTPNPWHVLGVGCLLHTDWDHPPNEAVLQVDAFSLTSAAKLQAEVAWDYYPQPEFALFTRPVPASDEAIQMILRSLPEMGAILEEVVRKWTEKDSEPGSEL